VFLMLMLAILMISNVKYPRLPGAGFRSLRQLGGLALYVVILVGSLTVPSYFLFPVGIAYVAFGALRAAVLNLADRGDDPADEDRRRVSLMSTTHRARRAGRGREHPE
jgi:phosphatidylserine synthase